MSSGGGGGGGGASAAGVGGSIGSIAGAFQDKSSKYCYASQGARIGQGIGGVVDLAATAYGGMGVGGAQLGGTIGELIDPSGCAEPPKAGKEQRKNPPTNTPIEPTAPKDAPPDTTTPPVAIARPEEAYQAQRAGERDPFAEIARQQEEQQRREEEERRRREEEQRMAMGISYPPY